MQPPLGSMSTDDFCRTCMLRSAADRAVAGVGPVAGKALAIATGFNFSSARTAGLLNFRAQSTVLSPAFERTDVFEPFSRSIRTMAMLGRSVETDHISGVIP